MRGGDTDIRMFCSDGVPLILTDEFVPDGLAFTYTQTQFVHI